MIVLMAGHSKGILGLLTLLSLNQDVFVIANTQDVRDVCKTLKIPHVNTWEHGISEICNCKLFLSVHGRQIISQVYLKDKGINIHPYYFLYKGANPVERAFRDGCMSGFVTAHKMTDTLDTGVIVAEKHFELNSCISVEQMKSKLIPIYVEVIIETLRKKKLI